MKHLLIVLAIVNLCGCSAKINADMTTKDTLQDICGGFDFNGDDNVTDSYWGNRDLWLALDTYYRNEKSRKLVVFMDGTSNDVKNPSNIRRMYRVALRNACAGVPVIPYYDQGVGAHRYDRIIGNAFGSGISLNIRQAYRFLVDTYQESDLGGDEIFIFGFSRGAFSARSLNGFIEHAGLIDKKTIFPFSYEQMPILNSMTKHHQAVAVLYKAYHVHDDGQPRFQQRLKTSIDEARQDFDDRLQVFRVKVTAIGVFDTVTALGLGRKPEPDNHRLDFYAAKGFHAMSLDEQRDDFNLLRFNNEASVGTDLEEVWFPGVHANVGGGYLKGNDCRNPVETKDCMEITPLNWMVSRFAEYQIFYPEHKFVECNDGILHDEFLDKNLYKKFGSIKRKPLKGDNLHISARDRVNLPKLPAPHPIREADGRYHPENLVLPLAPGYYTIVD